MSVSGPVQVGRWHVSIVEPIAVAFTRYVYAVTDRDWGGQVYVAFPLPADAPGLVQIAADYAEMADSIVAGRVDFGDERFRGVQVGIT